MYVAFTWGSTALLHLSRSALSFLCGAEMVSLAPFGSLFPSPASSGLPPAGMHILVQPRPIRGTIPRTACLCRWLLPASPAALAEASAHKAACGDGDRTGTCNCDCVHLPQHFPVVRSLYRFSLTSPKMLFPATSECRY